MHGKHAAARYGAHLESRSKWNNSKGVFCAIKEDEDMPIDEQGIRADIVIDAASPINRMNPGQLFEQAINRISEFIKRRLTVEFQSDPKKAISNLLDYYNDINPNFAKLVVETNNSPMLMHMHLESVIEKGIFLHIPPSLNTITGLQLIKHLKEKWDIPVSRVTYNKRDIDGNIIGTFTTVNPVCIGPKYVMLLSKIPSVSSAGVAHTNNFGVPIRLKGSQKHRHPFSMTPIRFGEDERRIINIDIGDTKEDLRFICLQSASMTGVSKAIETLLRAPHPTNIEQVDISTEDLIRSNNPIALFHHMMQTCGIDSLYTKTDKPIPAFGDMSIYVEDEIDDHAHKTGIDHSPSDAHLSDFQSPVDTDD
jgi:RNA polymerase Rpb2, domain 6